MGTLTGSAYWWPNDTTTPTPAKSFFDLQATAIQAEWDTSGLYLDAKPVAFYPSFVTHGSATYTNAVIQGASSGTNRYLFVFPDGPVQVLAACAAAQASTQSQLSAVSHADNARNPTNADTANALQVAPCTDTTVRLRGSFRVILWDWNANVTAQEGSGFLWSGKAPQDTVSGPDARPYASRAQQVYLTVHNGTMTLPSTPRRPSCS